MSSLSPLINKDGEIDERSSHSRWSENSRGAVHGLLKDVQPYDLAALVLDEAVRRAGIEPTMVDHIIMGQSYQNGEYVNTRSHGICSKPGGPKASPV